MFSTIACAYPIIKETIPASNLGYHSNNRYDGFPPLMNDGRSVIANGRSEPLTHNALLKDKKMTNNAQYRSYMINNARQIMETDFRNSSNDTGYPEGMRFADYLLSSTVGNNTKQKHAQYVATDVKLVYKSSDLKDIYMSREQLDMRRDYPAFPSTHK